MQPVQLEHFLKRNQTVIFFALHFFFMCPSTVSFLLGYVCTCASANYETNKIIHLITFINNHYSMDRCLLCLCSRFGVVWRPLRFESVTAVARDSKPPSPSPLYTFAIIITSFFPLIFIRRRNYIDTKNYSRFTSCPTGRPSTSKPNQYLWLCIIRFYDAILINIRSPQMSS